MMFFSSPFSSISQLNFFLPFLRLQFYQVPSYSDEGLFLRFLGSVRAPSQRSTEALDRPNVPSSPICSPVVPTFFNELFPTAAFCMDRKPSRFHLPPSRLVLGVFFFCGFFFVFGLWGGGCFFFVFCCVVCLLLDVDCPELSFLFSLYSSVAKQ